MHCSKCGVKQTDAGISGKMFLLIRCNLVGRGKLMFDPKSIDLDQLVTVPYLRGGEFTLRTAIREAMALPETRRGFVEIFRSGEPPVLTRREIEAIAAAGTTNPA